jgi:hypothetical protein
MEDGILGGLKLSEGDQRTAQRLAAPVDWFKRNADDAAFMAWIDVAARSTAAEEAERERKQQVAAFVELIRGGLVHELKPEIEEAEIKRETVKGYVADFQRFMRTLDDLGPAYAAMKLGRPPVPPEVVAWLIMLEREMGTPFNTIQRLVTALTYVHEVAGFVSPKRDPLVRAALKKAQTPAEPIDLTKLNGHGEHAEEVPAVVN